MRSKKWSRPKAEAMEYEASWKKELLAKELPIYPLVGQCEAREDGPQTEMEKMAKDLAEKLTDEELIHLVVGEVNKSQNANALGSAGIMVPGARGNQFHLEPKIWNPRASYGRRPGRAAPEQNL